MPRMRRQRLEPR
jgi:hypothetical protein